jgi:hypothetical protein
MPDILLEPAPANPSEFYVTAHGRIVGRVLLFTEAPPGTPWMWVLDYAHHEDRTPTHGYQATRDDAMKAFAKSWHRK